MSKTAEQLTQETRAMHGSALSLENRGLTPVRPEPSETPKAQPKVTIFVTQGHGPDEPVVRGMKQVADQLKEVGITPIRAIVRPDGTFRYVPFDHPESSFEGQSFDIEDIRRAGVTSVVVPALDAAKNKSHIDRLAMNVTGDHEVPPIVLDASGAEAAKEVITTWGAGIGNYLRSLGWGQIAAIRFTTPKAQMLKDARDQLGADCKVMHRPGPKSNDKGAIDVDLLSLMTNRPEQIRELTRGRASVADSLGIKTKRIDAGADSLAATSGPAAGPPFTN